jgi:hypothetical protein
VNKTMPTINISVYLNNDEIGKYLKVKDILNDKLRKILKKELEKVL